MEEYRSGEYRSISAPLDSDTPAVRYPVTPLPRYPVTPFRVSSGQSRARPEARMSALAIPATMDEVTPAWLTAALRESGVLKTATVTSADRVTIGVGVGLLGDIARVTLTYDRDEPGAPATLVAKIPTADPGGRGIAQMLGFYEKEARFYTTLADQCAIGSPRCYYAAMKPEEVLFIILMEDMGGLRMGDQVAGCSVEDARLIVRNLARFHAQWWDSPKLDSLDWVPSLASPIIKLGIGAYLQSIEPFLRLFGDRITSAQRDLVIALGPRLAATWDAVSSGPVTLAHGDPRLDNIFFGSTDGAREITVIDWQVLIKARGPLDIGYLLSQSLSPADRKAHEESIVREYLATLEANGVTGYSWEQCWYDYRAAVLYCIAYPVLGGGSLDLANDRAVALVQAMTDRSFAAVTDLDCAELLKDFEERPFVMPGT